MGKRKKSTRGPVKKKKDVLPTNFQCLFCNHETSVTVKLDRKAGVGHLQCKVCGQNFQTSIHFLTEGVDVYAEWIDACEAVQNETAADADVSAPRDTAFRGTIGEPKSQRAGNRQDQYENDFVVDDEGDMEAGYVDEE